MLFWSFVNRVVQYKTLKNAKNGKWDCRRTSQYWNSFMGNKNTIMCNNIENKSYKCFAKSCNMLCNCSHYAEKDKLELSLGLWVNNISITSKCMQALKLSKNQSKYDLAILFFWRKLPFKPTLIRIMLVNGSFHLHQKMPKSVHHF